MVDHNSVSHDDCSKRRARLMPKMSGWALGIVWAALAVFLAFLMQITWRAWDTSIKATSELGKHVAAQTVHEAGVNQSLKRLETGQGNNRQLLDQILRNGAGQ